MAGELICFERTGNGKKQGIGSEKHVVQGVISKKEHILEIASRIRKLIMYQVAKSNARPNASNY
jgi:hypothetical protein